MMPRWKQWLLRSYLGGSWPYRRWNNARLENMGRAPLMILFYHRVADSHPNGWTISNSLFETEIRYLKRHFEMVSMAEIQHRLRTGRSPRPAVHITFDDGYAENCEFAIPFLIREQVPTTYFVTLKNVVEQLPFPHDASRGVPFRPNTIEQLREMARAGLEIGGHTRTHPVLANIQDSERLYDEVVTASRELGELCDQSVRYFACPFGHRKHFHPQLFEMAREAGFQAVVSAYGGYNFVGDDDFHLRRIHGAPVMVELQNWVTLDPVKVVRTRRLTSELAAWCNLDPARRHADQELVEVPR